MLITYSVNPCAHAVAFSPPNPDAGNVTVIAVLLALAGTGVGNVTTNELTAGTTKCPNVYVIVPLIVPVTVTLTFNAPVAPPLVSWNPVIHVVLLATAGKVATAAAFAWLPLDAVTKVAPAGRPPGPCAASTHTEHSNRTDNMILIIEILLVKSRERPLFAPNSLAQGRSTRK
jgi:hypothetical protein